MTALPLETFLCGLELDEKFDWRATAPDMHCRYSLIQCWCVRRCDSDLFVWDDVIKSSEGTNQHDPLTMPMHAIAIFPLIRRLGQQVLQVRYSDDAGAMGMISQVCYWWNQVVDLGPRHGYHECKYRENFADHEEGMLLTGCWNIWWAGHENNNNSRPYLGSPIATRNVSRLLFTRKFWIGQRS